MTASMAEDNAMRQLSSSLTFVWKFIIPLLWLTGFGIATVVVFRASEDASRPDGTWMHWLFLVAFIVGTVLIFWAVARIKRVSLKRDKLIISNFRTEIDVPLKYVSHFKGSILLSPELIWIKFKRRTDFGESIVFMPPIRFRSGFTRPPMTAELNEMLTKEIDGNGHQAAAHRSRQER